MRHFETFEDLLRSMREEARKGRQFAKQTFTGRVGIAVWRLPWTEADLWCLEPAAAAMAPGPYRALVMTDAGLGRIVRSVNHGHEPWEDCDLCLASDVMDS